MTQDEGFKLKKLFIYTVVCLFFIPGYIYIHYHHPKPKSVVQAQQVKNVFSWKTAGTDTVVRNNSPACMCDPDALHQAVLDRIFDAGFGSEFQNPSTESSLRRMQKDLDRLNRLAHGLKDTCLASAYLYWLDFYQTKHDELNRKLLHPETVPPDEDETRQKKKDREVAECKRKGIVPRLPIEVQ